MEASWTDNWIERSSWRTVDSLSFRLCSQWIQRNDVNRADGVNGWMDGWMKEEWMDGWMNGRRMDEWMDGWMNMLTGGWVDGWTDGYVGGWMN